MACEDAAWLERKSLYARTVTLKVRYGDFTTITRSDTRTPASRDERELGDRAVSLLEKTEAGRRPVRLLGVTLHGLVDEPGAVPEDPWPRLPFDEEGSTSG